MFKWRETLTSFCSKSNGTLIRITKKSILALPRTVKRLIVMLLDICIAALTVWLAFYLRIGEFLPLISRTGEFYPLPALVASILLSVPIFTIFGLCRPIFRYSSSPVLFAVTRAVVLYGLVFLLTGHTHCLTVLDVVSLGLIHISIGI